MSPLELLTVRRDAAKADADRARLSDADKAEAAMRAEIATYEATARAADAEARGLDLARREDAARETLGPKVPVSTLEGEADGHAHTFVLRYAGSRAFNAWESGIGLSHLGSKDPQTRKKVDRAEVNKTFALASVYDWNGVVIVPGSGALAELSALLDGFAGIASALALAGRALSGAAMEDRKSGG